MAVLIIIVIYFLLLLLISFLVGRNNSNATYFLGNRKSPWYIVSIGMIGSSISGVTFVSVPGWVKTTDFSYMQMVLGFFCGYLVVAQILLPLYYKLKLITIYSYLKKRFGIYSYKTGAFFFILSRSISAAARLYIVAIILKTFVFDKIANINIPFIWIVLGIMLIISLYTFRTGIKTVIWTDTIQTLLLISALCLIIFEVAKDMHLTNISEIFSTISGSKYFKVFVFDDWQSRQHFIKQFFSGIFVTIAMTGLDQDMMQKNLSCKTLKESQRNMYLYGFMFIPINFLFLSLGTLLLIFSQQQNISLPLLSDEIVPFMVSNGYFSTLTMYLFVIGLLAAAFSSVDSAITSLATSFYIDILGNKTTDDSSKKHNLRTWVHIGFCVLFVFLILIFKLFKDKSAIDTIYTIVSYTYGPLLGLFSFGLFTNRLTKDKYVPYIAVLSPIFVSLLSIFSLKYFKYQFGYELLIINGLISFSGLLLISKKEEKHNPKI